MGRDGHEFVPEPNRLLRLSQPESFLFRLAACGQVTRDLDEADELARRIAHRSDDHVGPKARTVLAKPVALVLEAPLARRELELPVRLAGCHVLGREEAGEVRAQDLLLSIARDAL